jgi:putative PIN family toxin of toxin-antitoxin system
MRSLPLLRVVIDTNVVFEGLTKKGGASGLIIDAWFAGLMVVCVSNTLAYEYDDVLSRKLAPERWILLKPLLGKLLSIAEYTSIYFSWRPTSPDPGDDLAIDCAMNAGAIVVTSNIKDFRSARELRL